MNKTRQSLLGSVSSVFYTLLNGLFTLIVIRQIIIMYGSDFNGLNSTATQFINMLLIIEGGFALAANVALFAPLSAGDTKQINGILSAVNRRFHWIAVVFCGVGFAAAFLFASMIKSDLQYYLSFWTFIMLVASTGFNLSFAIKYKILFQSDQKEYLLNNLSIAFLIFSNVLILCAIKFLLPMLILRLIIMICAVGNSITIALLCRKRYPFINLRAAPDNASIRGTGDVFAQKITGVLYYTMPILFIAAFVGTKTASVYAVYNTVFLLIRSFGNAFINAPRMSLGRLITEQGTKSEHLKNVFDQYELCLVLAITAMLSVSAVTIMPFVRIYTPNITDTNYINLGMAVLLTLICFFECLHIPSGNLINMAGKFRAGRNIQLAAGAVLILLLIIGGIFGGITGILIAVLITAVLLAALEIGYVRIKFLSGGWGVFARVSLINTAAGLVLIVAEQQIQVAINGFFGFFLYAGLLAIVNTFVLIAINLLVNRTLTIAVIRRFQDAVHLLARQLKRSGGESL